MKKAAIIIASGFGEGEALTIADIIKRAHLQCDLVGFEQEVKGGHEIIVRCDHILNETLLDYDMVILPGGYGGAEAMKNNPTLISYLQQMNEKGKYVCAMCAAPIVLEKANLLVDKKFTQAYDKIETAFRVCGPGGPHRRFMALRYKAARAGTGRDTHGAEKMRTSMGRRRGTVLGRLCGPRLANRRSFGTGAGVEYAVGAAAAVFCLRCRALPPLGGTCGARCAVAAVFA